VAWLEAAAGAIGLVALVVFGWGMMRGTIAPPSSWAIWAAPPAVVFAAQAFGHAERSGLGLSWLPLAELAGTLGILALAVLRHAAGWPVWWEWWLIAGVALALIVWRLTSNPAAAVFIPSVTDLAGTIPTLVSDYKNPAGETKWSRASWAGLIAAGAIGLIAVRHHSLILWAYPGCLVIMGAAVTMAWMAGERAQPAVAS
jgi:hypothetical protein